MFTVVYCFICYSAAGRSVGLLLPTTAYCIKNAISPFFLPFLHSFIRSFMHSFIQSRIFHFLNTITSREWICKFIRKQIMSSADCCSFCYCCCFYCFCKVCYLHYRGGRWCGVLVVGDDEPSMAKEVLLFAVCLSDCCINSATTIQTTMIVRHSKWQKNDSHTIIVWPENCVSGEMMCWWNINHWWQFYNWRIMQGRMRAVKCGMYIYGRRITSLLGGGE